MDTSQRDVQRGGIENIAPHDLCGRLDEGAQLVRVAGQTSQNQRLLFESWDEPPTDITCAPVSSTTGAFGISRLPGSGGDILFARIPG